MSALPPKADIEERDRQERRTVRFTLTGYANRMRAFSIYTAPIGVRLSVICWDYGQCRRRTSLPQLGHFRPLRSP